MIRETPDYHTETCSHCDLPAGDDVMWINGMCFHKPCVERMADEMLLEEEYRKREVEEGITDYQLSADDADYQGWVRR